MLSIAYAISPVLTKYLARIEQLRRNIVLYPLPAEKELSLQFQAAMSRIVFALSTPEKQIPFDEVKKALELTFTQTAKENPAQKQIIRYKQALDYIKRDWLVSNQVIYPETVIKLHALFSRGKVRVSKKDLREVLDYLQATSDNPFIQAAIAKLLLRNLSPFTHDNELLSTLVGYLFIYKAGLDCRGFLILELLGEYADKYLQQYMANKGKSNITGWLEYFSKAVSLQLEHAYAEITKTQSGKRTSAYDKFAELNERQKEILNVLDNPNMVITNRTIQKMFKISQITASRDLARMAALGLLIPHGKGRSVRYTRI